MIPLNPEKVCEKLDSLVLEKLNYQNQRKKRQSVIGNTLNIPGQKQHSSEARVKERKQKFGNNQLLNEIIQEQFGRNASPKTKQQQTPDCEIRQKAKDYIRYIHGMPLREGNEPELDEEDLMCIHSTSGILEMEQLVKQMGWFKRFESTLAKKKGRR